MDKELTYKQQIFCQEYAIDYNATRAYMVAYPNISKDQTAASAGGRLLRNVEIEKRIKELQANIAETCGISRIMIVNKLKAIALQGEEETQKECLKAIEIVNKMLGYNEPEKIEHSGEVTKIINLGSGVNPHETT